MHRLRTDNRTTSCVGHIKKLIFTPKSEICACEAADAGRISFSGSLVRSSHLATSACRGPCGPASDCGGKTLETRTTSRRSSSSGFSFRAGVLAPP